MTSVSDSPDNTESTTSDTEPPTFEGLVQRLAEIEDELNSRGIVELLKEKDTLRTELKDAMIAAEELEIYDEVSGYEAKLQPSTTVSYDIPRLKSALIPAHVKLVIRETVDGKKLEELIRMGVTTRTHLEKAGAVGKTLKSVSLIVKQRKVEVDGTDSGPD